MSNSDSVIPSQVRDLIKESQKIRGWVDRLADHAADARPEVVEKVRGDYEQRLQSVNGELAEHRAALVTTLDTRRSEVDSLRKDRDEHAAELEEARLRHAVGEFSDSQWTERKETIEQMLEDLDELLGGEEDAVAELTDIIGRIGASGPQLVVDAELAEQEELAQRERLAEESAGEAEEPTAAATDEDEEPASESELTVTSLARELATEGAAADQVGESEEDEPAEAVAEAAATASDSETGIETEADEDGGEYLDELEFLESLSLGDSDRFDAVSAMLDETEEGNKGSD